MSIFGYRSKEYCDERGREYYFDNAKFILIFLVVLAHAISPLKSDMPIIKTMWTVINAMHMPCLIMISGYFAKSYIKKDGSVKTQRLLTYVVYYLAAQIAVSLFEYFILGDKNISRSVLAPRSSLWYLACLCWWFLILPYVTKLKPKYLLLFSVIFALMIGYDTKAGNFMSVTRAINHFPFFLIGYYFKKEWLFKFRNKLTQLASIIIIAVISILTYLNLDIIPGRIITSNYNYYNSQLKILNTHATMFLNRVIFYVVALILCACFMLLIPRGKAVFTRFGSRTLQVYILHRFLYLADLKFEWYAPLKSSYSGFLIMCLIALAATIILSLKPFEYPFKLLAKIKLKRFKRDDCAVVKI